MYLSETREEESMLLSHINGTERSVATTEGGDGSDIGLNGK